MDTKACSSCKEQRDITAFYPKMGRCKSCHNTKMVEWQRNNPEKVKASKDRWRAKPESRSKELVATRRWQKEHPEAYKLQRLKQSLKFYGLSLEQYEDLYKKQDGLCAICKTHKDRLHVDHNHDTKVVRSLLCSNCNTGLGLFKESSELLSIANAYLKAHNQI